MNRKKAWLIPLIPLGIAAIGAVVMLLWNALIPDIFHLGEITFWQALGLLVLSKILFSGGPRGGGRHKRHQEEWRKKMGEKWEHMSPEERQQFKMKLRYKGGFGNWEFETGHDKDRSPENPSGESPGIETK